MYANYKRRTFSRRQALANDEKRRQSEKLIGKEFVHNGRVCRVVSTDFVSGDALVRVGSRDEAYHPDQVQKMYLANPWN